MDATGKSAPRSRLIDVLILLAIALIGVVTWKLQPRSDVAIPLSNCNLNLQICAADLPGGGSIEFSVEPRPIPVVRPLALRIAVEGIEPEKIEVDFAGTAMNMGFNRPQLKRVASGRYEGQTTLPVCVSGGMEWQATVIVTAGGKVIALPFRFDSGHA
jgi:hypothetical protein